MYDNGPNWTRLARTVGILIVLIVLPIIVLVHDGDADRRGPRRRAGPARGVRPWRAALAGHDGWVFFNPMTEQIVEFPISVHNIVWTASANEGAPRTSRSRSRPRRASRSTRTSGSRSTSSLVKAPHLYHRFREDEPDASPTATCATPSARPSTSSRRRCRCRTSTAPGKTHLLNDALGGSTAALARTASSSTSSRSTARCGCRTTVGAINRAMEATQNAIQAENRVRQIRAEADQAVAASHGHAEAARQRAPATPTRC